MRTTILAGIVALSASTSLAQTGAPPAPPASPPEAAAPAAPQTAAPDPAASRQAGGPANLCQELLAFMQAPPPEPAAPAPAAAPKPPAAPPQQASAEQGTPAQPAPPAQEAAPAQQGGTPTPGGAPAKPETDTGSAQQITGQDGVATDSPEPSDEKVATGTPANAPQKDSRAAPTPPEDATSTPKESVITVAQAQELAAANDIAACQTTARDMRVAGIAMPPPLMALAALDLQYQQRSGAASQPSGAADPAPTGQAPASQIRTPQ